MDFAEEVTELVKKVSVTLQEAYRKTYSDLGPGPIATFDRLVFEEMAQAAMKVIDEYENQQVEEWLDGEVAPLVPAIRRNFYLGRAVLAAEEQYKQEAGYSVVWALEVRADPDDEFHAPLGHFFQALADAIREFTENEEGGTDNES